MDLSILVVTYNTKDLIEKCIQSIINYNGKYTIEIIVVDNNSSDGTPELIKSKFPQIKYIQNKFNYGFAVGMNQAFRITSGKYVMTFNPDAEIYDNSIDAAIEYLNLNPDTGLLGMKTEDSNGIIEVPHHEFCLIEKIETVRLFFNKKHQPNNSDVVEVQWIWGTSIFARKNELGDSFFIEDDFLFWEEYWLAKKIKAQGLKIKILMNYKMLHHISASFKADETKLGMIRILSAVNGHKAKINEYGKISTYSSYLVKVIDSFLMFFLLNLLQLVKKSKRTERRLMIIHHRAHMQAYFMLFLLGSSYQKQFQEKCIMFLNKGVQPTYPPIFSYEW